MSEYHEQLPQPETGINLTEREKSDLSQAAVRLLKTRGRVVNPIPEGSVWEGQGEQPKPSLKAEVSYDELETFGLPYIKVVIISDEETEFGSEGPDVLLLDAQSASVRQVTLEEGELPITAVGDQTQRLALIRDADLGIYVEEASWAELKPGDRPDIETSTKDDQGNPIHLKGSGLILTEDVPLLSRTSWVELSNALTNIQ